MGVRDLIEEVCAVGVALACILDLGEDSCSVGVTGRASASEVFGDSAATTMRRRFASDFRGRLMRAGVAGAVEIGPPLMLGWGSPDLASTQ